MISTDELEQQIKSLLLRNIIFTLDNKTIKAGKLILFTVKNFFCVFTLHDIAKNKKIVYELPYPFTVTNSVSSIDFDYTIDRFCERNKGIEDAFSKIKIDKPSKLFDKKVVVIPE